MSENHIAGKRYLENYDKYMEELNKAKGESERQIDTSLRILLLGCDIKVVGGDKKAEYQHISGNKKGHTVYKGTDENYTTLSTFLKEHAFNGNVEELQKKLSKSYRLFYSSVGIIKEYKKEDLEKEIKKLQSGNFIMRLFK